MSEIRGDVQTHLSTTRWFLDNPRHHQLLQPTTEFHSWKMERNIAHVLLHLRSQRPDDGTMSLRPTKRARETIETDDASETPPDAPRASTMMPHAVIPLVWDFLLESSSTINTDSDFKYVDFKSIRSFMLVSRETKDAFDACNGRQICAQALKRDSDFKIQFLNNFILRVEQAFSERRGINHTMMNLLRSLSEEAERASMTAINARVTLVQNNLLRNQLAAEFDQDLAERDSEPFSTALDRVHAAIDELERFIWLDEIELPWPLETVEDSDETASVVNMFPPDNAEFIRLFDEDADFLGLFEEEEAS